MNPEFKSNSLKITNLKPIELKNVLNIFIGF